MADDQDDAQKTEDPTPKKLQDALKKGQVVTSKEVSSFMMLLLLTILLGWVAPFVMRHATMMLKRFVEHSSEFSFSPDSYPGVFKDIVLTGMWLMLIPIASAVIVAILSSVMQHGFIFSAESIKPKLEKLSLIKGLKRLFSMKSMVEFIKGIFKISIVSAVAVFVVMPDLGVMQDLHSYTISGILALLLSLAVKVMVGVSVVMGFIAALDFLYQRFEHTKSLRMTKQEVKDEYKQTEGSPEVKAKLRKIRNERQRKRMMSAVPKADVIITNPTHYSVALQYDENEHPAPMVIAKGIDQIALKIREVAKEHNIPIMRNPPLTRAIYETVEIDEPIQEAHYKAIAEIIAYVYKMKGKMKQAS